MPSRTGLLVGVTVLLTVVVASAAGVFRDFDVAQVSRAESVVRGLAGAAIGAGIALVVRRSMRRAESAEADRDARRAVTAVLVSLFALAAMTTAPRHDAAGQGGVSPTTASLLPSPGTTDNSPPASAPEEDAPQGSEDVGSGLMGIIIAFGLVALIAIMFTYRRLRDDRKGRLAPFDAAPPVPGTTVVDEEAAAESFARTARLLLDEDDLRRAVIAAYGALLDGLATAGAPRLDYEAPEEHLHRALALLAMAADDSAAVTHLFLVARFSDHPITDLDRRRAVEALLAAERELRERSVRT